MGEWVGEWVGIFEERALEGIFEERALTRVHSTKAEKSSRGPSSDDSALHAVFRLAS